MTNTHDWRRDRKARSKRGFDDDMPQEGGWAPPPTPSYAPSSAPRRSSAPVASGPDVSAVVKRFDPERGFGFVAVDGGGGDAFLHISVLQRAGADTVAPGTKLRVRVGQGERGPQVAEVLEVGPVGEVPASPPRGAMGGAGPRPGGGAGAGAGFRAPPPPGSGEEMQGTVKWYSAEKGFGFVTPSDGGKDVFVHATALERSGLRPLTEGQAVTLRVVQGKKGPEAASVTTA